MHWDQASAGAYWSSGPYCISTYRVVTADGPAVAAGYRLYCHRESVGEFDTLAEAKTCAEDHAREQKGF